jgi:thiosulfate/3-mercaptopyruvate sulfurtransferase
MTKRGIKDFNRQCKLMLSKLGIKQDNKVIFHENVSGITASRGVWMVMYFSRNACTLDGGFEKWKRQKLPKEMKSIELRNFRFKGEPDSNVIADAVELNKSISK